MMKAQDLVQSIERSLEELAAATDQARVSQEILDYLEFTTKFHRYSFYNTASIYLHCRHATHVAGFNAWKKLGRFVRKGEKGIPILAPCTIKVESEEDEDAQTTKITAFKVVYVFDVSQTDGTPIPEAPITVTGDDAGLLACLEQIATKNNIALKYTPLAGSHHGTSFGGRIEADDRLEPAGKAAVLIHELAHELLHRGPDRESISRQQRELEAEATAYVVCSHFDLPAASANYLVLWQIARGQITEVFQRIHKVSVQLIKDVEASK